MKICLIAPWFPSLTASNPESKQGTFLYRQTMEFSKRGHKFKVITIKWDCQPDHELIGDFIEIYRIPYIFKFSKIRYPIPNFIKLNKRLKEICSGEEIDLVEFVTQIYLTTLPIFFVKKLKIPLIVDVFGGIPGVFGVYGDKMIDTIAHIYERLLGDRVLKSADGILVENSSLHNYFSEIGIDVHRIYAITKGVDTELFKPRTANNFLKAELGIKDDDVVILYVGRLDLVKGINYFLQAARKLIPHYKNLKLLIVGDGSLRREYEAFAKSFSDNIIFTGFRDDVPELMNISDIFVLPSLSEGAPNAVMEASASGLPVIASEVGEVPQIISDSKTGILVKPKDIDGLVNALEKLIENPLLSKKMGEVGRKRMEEEYSWEIVCKKIENAYQEVIDRYR